MNNAQFWGGTAASYEIDQSLRFDNNSTQFLRRDWSDQGNRQTWTFSTWLKLAPFGSNSRIWTEGDDAGSKLFTSLMLQGADNKLRFYSYNGSDVYHNHISAAQFRDYSAWYHIVVAYDTTQSTADDRIKIYVNGAEITDWDTKVNATSNYNSYVGYNGGHSNIGQYVDGSAGGVNNNFSGYMAETIFIEGSQLAPTDFGETNDDGVWVPKEYTGSFSGHSWRLKYNSSDGLGNDSGGNNDFTANNFESTTISSSNLDNDIDIPDTPTNNHVTLSSNDYDPDSNEPDKGGLSVVAGGNWSKARSTLAYPKTGTWYYEVDCQTAYASYIGVCQGNAVLQSGSPTSGSADDGLWIYISDGTRNWNGSYASSGAGSISNGDVIGVTYNADTNTAKWYKNNSHILTQTVAPDPYSNEVFPYYGMYDNTVNTINFGQFAFRYTPPDSAKAMVKANLADVTIKNGKEHMNTVQWVGNGNNNRDITGLDFQPDLVWIKRKDGTNNANIYDSIRGVTKHLTPSYNYADQTTANSLTAFNSDGFEVGTGASDNTSNFNMIAWCWKAGESFTPSQTGGLTSLSGSRNTDAGFSIIRYTGSNTTNSTVGHGLSSAPDFVIAKSLNNPDDWVCYHRYIHNTNPENYYLKLNTNDAAAGDNEMWKSNPTSSVVNLGSYNFNNRNAPTIMYCWHSVEGYSKMGGYQGNNKQGEGQFVFTGFRPQWLLIKRTSTTDHWAIYDASRDVDNPCTRQLYADLPSSASNGSESNSSVNAIDFCANGFKHRWNDSRLNSTSNNYVYVAFAENPFIAGNTAPATAR